MNKLTELVMNCLLLFTMFICSVAVFICSVAVLFCLLNPAVEDKSLSDFSVEVEVICE